LSSSNVAWRITCRVLAHNGLSGRATALDLIPIEEAFGAKT
jgi:hypothetical protein